MHHRYPPARREEAVDSLAGITFADPYRWLENENDEVRTWQRAQADLARAHIAEWDGYPTIRELVAEFHCERRLDLPRQGGGIWFWPPTTIASGGQVMTSTSLEGERRLLFTADGLFPDAGAVISWLSPSPDGTILAFGACFDGSENNRIQLLDMANGQLLPHPPTPLLMDNWTGGAHWLADSSGFFFVAIEHGAESFGQTAYLYQRSVPAVTHELDIPWVTTQEYRSVVVSADGRHAVALERLGTTIPVAIARLDADGVFIWRPFITLPTNKVAGQIIGDSYVGVTDLGSDRGRLVSIPLDASDPNNPEQWTEILGESDALLRSVTPVGDRLYVHELVDTYARVRIVSLDGSPLGDMPLPGDGAISEWMHSLGNLSVPLIADRFLFAFSTLTESWGIYSHRAGDAEIETIEAPRVALAGAVVEDCSARSADGTLIPYHVVRPARADAAKPALIYAYGGMGAVLVPHFPGAMAAFVAAGGSFVLAHLRGGGEFGRQWEMDGSFAHKQNCYDDLYAIADDLIRSGLAAPGKLGVIGVSHGGLMAAVAVTQRPDLWGAAMSRVPRTDLIGSCRTAYGRMCAVAYHGDIEDASDVRRLADISPYHLVREGTVYPPIFIDAGENDPRCHAWHARKFAASLQHASAGTAPILLHVWEGVGHGGATDNETMIEVQSEWIAFAVRHLCADPGETECRG